MRYCISLLITRYLVDSAVKHAQIFGEGSQYLVRYDEIVQMHACELCRAKADTAGDLLAWHATHSAEVLQRSASPRRVMVWQDVRDCLTNVNTVHEQCLYPASFCNINCAAHMLDREKMRSQY